MGVNSLPKTVTRQRRDCDLNPGLLRLSPARSVIEYGLPLPFFNYYALYKSTHSAHSLLVPLQPVQS